MKARMEPAGLHYYCRKSGTHILFDEIKIEPSAYSISPRTVSMAITDQCDFACSYCYVNLRDRFLPKEKIIAYCKELDRLGTFDVAFGGGEPTLHCDLAEICQRIWSGTQLGLSITTHGHHLTNELISELKGNISLLRVSIDGVEPIYSQLRKKPFENLLPKLQKLSGQIPFGINTVVNKLNIDHLDDVKKLLLEYGGVELLLLPMWHKGKYALTQNEWIKLERWIDKNYLLIPIRISSGAKSYLQLPYLFEDVEWENDYAFIGIDNTFRKDSFTTQGLEIDSYESFESLLRDWKLRPIQN